MVEENFGAVYSQVVSTAGGLAAAGPAPQGRLQELTQCSAHLWQKESQV